MILIITGVVLVVIALAINPKPTWVRFSLVLAMMLTGLALVAIGIRLSIGVWS